MATRKQILANRRNAQRSTGPKTSEGKRRSSVNSLKLGVFSQSVLIPGEAPTEWSALAHDLYHDWNPVGTTERTLVELLIATLWRLRRLQGIEGGLFKMYRTQAGVDYGPAFAYVRDAKHVDCLGRLARSESALERRFFRLLGELNQLQAGRRKRETGSVPAD